MRGIEARRYVLALRLPIVALLGCTTLLATACGFGRYNEEATLAEVSADDGIPNHGQWWPWACTSGGYPAPQSPNTHYVAAVGCGPGGPFALNVDGCQINGTWAALGLTNVGTTTPSSIPAVGGWQVAATITGNTSVNCTADEAAGDLIVTCNTADESATVVCTSKLTPVTG